MPSVPATGGSGGSRPQRSEPSASGATPPCSSSIAEAGSWIASSPCRRKKGWCCDSPPSGFDFVAFEAQGLELQGLSLVSLVAHRNDVVQLAGLRRDGRTAELAHPVLFCQQSRSAAAGVVPRLCSKCRKTSRLAPASRCPR